MILNKTRSFGHLASHLQSPIQILMPVLSLPKTPISAGTAVVMNDKAALWTDGRYFLQLNSGWILMRVECLPLVSGLMECWLLVAKLELILDQYLFSADSAEKLKEAISKRNHELVYLYDCNLVDEIWNRSKRKPPDKPI